MSVQSTIARGKRALESRMLDVFDIKTPTGKWVYDDFLKEDVQSFTLLFTTKGRVKVSGGLAVREYQAGDRAVEIATRELHIPVDSPTVPPNAVAVVVSLDPSSDPSLAGAVLRLVGPAPGSQTTARRLEVKEVLT